MNTTLSPLARAPRLLEKRLAALETRIREGDEASWGEYVQVVLAISAALTHTAPGTGGNLISTAALAGLLGVSTKTILRRRKAGTIGGAVQLGQRGRAALRWDAGAAVRAGQ